MLTEIEDGPEVTPPVVAPKDDYVPLTRAQAESLQRERDESRQSEKYWADMARNGRTAEPPAEPDDEDDARQFIDEDDAPDGIDGDTPEKLVDEFAAQGTKALDKRGYVKAADVKKMAAEIAVKVARQMIGQQVVRSTTDNTIMTQFPELKDPKSELYAATAKLYQEAVAMDPNAKKTPAALYLAAKAAKASLKPAPKPDDDEPEVESDRRRRADSQDSRPRGRSQVEDHDDMMGPEARQICKDMGITEAEFKEGQKAAGRRGRR
jgi:hypothetical protein